MQPDPDGRQVMTGYTRSSSRDESDLLTREPELVKLTASPLNYRLLQNMQNMIARL